MTGQRSQARLPWATFRHPDAEEFSVICIPTVAAVYDYDRRLYSCGPESPQMMTMLNAGIKPAVIVIDRRYSGDGEIILISPDTAFPTRDQDV